MTTSSFEQHDHLRRPQQAPGGSNLVSIRKAFKNRVADRCSRFA
jgi:hypothetical protein